MDPIKLEHPPDTATWTELAATSEAMNETDNPMNYDEIIKSRHKTHKRF